MNSCTCVMFTYIHDSISPATLIRIGGFRKCTFQKSSANSQTWSKRNKTRQQTSHISYESNDKKSSSASVMQPFISQSSWQRLKSQSEINSACSLSPFLSLASFVNVQLSLLGAVTSAQAAQPTGPTWSKMVALYIHSLLDLAVHWHTLTSFLSVLCDFGLVCFCPGSILFHWCSLLCCMWCCTPLQFPSSGGPNTNTWYMTHGS